MCCFLFEKEPYVCEKNNNKIIKNGFHIQFPKIFLSKKEQELILYPLVKKSYQIIFVISHKMQLMMVLLGKELGFFMAQVKGKFQPYQLTKGFNKHGNMIDNFVLT